MKDELGSMKSELRIAKKIAITFTILTALSFAPAFAQDDFGVGGFLGSDSQSGTAKNELTNTPASGGLPDEIKPIAQKAVDLLIEIAALLAVIYALYTGVIIMGAFGDEAKISKAKGHLLYLAIGLVVIAFAYGILKLVQHFLGTRSL